MNSITTSPESKLKRTEALTRSKAISIELRRVARRARVPRPVSSGGGGFRARRSDRFFRRFFIGSFIVLFILPAILSGLYLYAVAADQYVAEARFSVRSGESGGLEALAGLSSVLNVGQSSDGQIIAEYVKSRSLIEELEKNFDLRGIFRPGTWDFLAEACDDATAEEFVKYWRRQVKLNVERSSGLVSLSVRTFSPQDSLRLAREIVRLSEGMVNRLTRRNEEASLQEASRELDFARQRLEKAVAAMRDARIEAGVLDVTLAASAYSQVLTELHIALSKLETQINALKENNASNAPQLVSLQAQAHSLRAQIAGYENRMTGRTGGGDDDSNLAIRASLLADKQVELKIAQDEYALAVSTYESARLTSERQRSYLLTYIQPSLPEESLYPKRGFAWAGASALSFLLWALVAGLAVLVRDHTAA